MNFKKYLISLTIISISFFGAVSCKHNDGPAETAGKKMDNTTKDLGNAIEDACEKVKKGANAKDTDC